MKSTLINMTAVLLGITLVASAGVGVVNMITQEPIAKAKEAATTAALGEVLPSFDQTTIQELTIDDMPILVYTATKDGAVAGYAVQSMTKNGFSGVIRMMVGFKPDGEVINVNVLEQTETPGLGTKMADEGNILLTSVQGKKLETKKLVDGKLAVTKDGGDVDALTAATISSRAYVDAINRAWMAYRSVVTGTTPTDVASGATSASGGATPETATDTASGATAHAATEAGSSSADAASGATSTSGGEQSPADAASGATPVAGESATEQTSEPTAQEGGQNE